MGSNIETQATKPRPDREAMQPFFFSFLEKNKKQTLKVLGSVMRKEEEEEEKKMIKTRDRDCIKILIFFSSLCIY